MRVEVRVIARWLIVQSVGLKVDLSCCVENEKSSRLRPSQDVLRLCGWMRKLHAAATEGDGDAYTTGLLGAVIAMGVTGTGKAKIARL